MIRVALVLLLTSAPATAAGIYKCPGADGKVVYQGAPCKGPDGKQLDTDFNSIDTSPNAEAVARLRVYEATKAAEAAKARLLDAQCQSFIDQIERQRVWLRSSSSRYARESAKVEIGILNRRYNDAGCR